MGTTANAGNLNCQQRSLENTTVVFLRVVNSRDCLVKRQSDRITKHTSRLIWEAAPYLYSRLENTYGGSQIVCYIDWFVFRFNKHVTYTFINTRDWVHTGFFSYLEIFSFFLCYNKHTVPPLQDQWKTKKKKKLDRRPIVVLLWIAEILFSYHDCQWRKLRIIRLRRIPKIGVNE